MAEQLKSLKFSDNVLDYRSSYDVGGSMGYLLDRVSGRLFGNSGTGDFVLGPETPA